MRNQSLNLPSIQHGRSFYRRRSRPAPAAARCARSLPFLALPTPPLATPTTSTRRPRPLRLPATDFALHRQAALAAPAAGAAALACAAPPATQPGSYFDITKLNSAGDESCQRHHVLFRTATRNSASSVRLEPLRQLASGCGRRTTNPWMGLTMVNAPAETSTTPGSRCDCWCGEHHGNSSRAGTNTLPSSARRRTLERIRSSNPTRPSRICHRSAPSIRTLFEDTIWLPSSRNRLQTWSGKTINRDE